MNDVQQLIVKPPEALTDAECLALFEEMQKDPIFFIQYIGQHKKVTHNVRQTIDAISRS